ncbi:E3 ubiquitin-protein ligase TRIM38-like [Talpa occidentalis]|uniref:E3 ubiquitin-protein ligase TRIM38-like n=1 Tax=Talpa occidentalis TaxID=50954 RepID=UPI00188F5295|nr:E3 ubiquitin-protein ligase TRIM38-like [Talpa occidentalis]
MASALITKKMREEATCPICLQLMTEPVSIDCGHSFCRGCITDLLVNQRQGTSSLRRSHCPLCRAPFKKDNLRPIKQLENLIESIKELERERLCEEHKERLHLFCEDDGQLICWRCERSPQHRGHTTELVEEAALGYREIFQKALTELREEENQYQSLKLTTKEQIRQWREKTVLEKSKIHYDFENLYNFLRVEEKCCLWRLEREKEQTLKILQDNEASLEKQSQELKSHMQELEKKCQGPAQDLLQDMRDTLVRSLTVTLKVPEAVSLDLQTVCNVSELYLDLKKMLKSYQVRVTLDPGTAHTDTIVSDDRRQVTYGGPQLNLGNSLRFLDLPWVLGCECFTSGRHYFEVNVEVDSGWDLGVCLENVPKGAPMSLQPKSGFWVIRSCEGKDYVALTYPPTCLPLKEQIWVLGVFVDCEAGRVSFYNMTSTVSHIFTFPRASFSDTLRPFFGVSQGSALFLNSQ